MARGDTVRRFALLLVVLSVNICDSYAQATRMYHAGLLGTEVIMNCSATSSTDPLAWYYCTVPVPCDDKLMYKRIPPSTGGEESDLPLNTFRFHDNSGLGPNFDLAVIQISEALSTRYECLVAFVSRVNYIIGLGQVECPPAEMEVSAGEMVQLNCSVNYYQHPDYPQDPVLTWSSEGHDSSTAISERSGNNRMTRSWNLTLEALDNEALFTCEVGFADTPSGPITYNDSCETYFFVQHGVTTVTLGVGEGSSLAAPAIAYPGLVINCTSDGRPIPDISWVDENNQTLSDSSNLTITADMLGGGQAIREFTCTATNNVNGEVFSISQTGYYEIQEGPPIVQSGLASWVIPVAVCVPIVVLAGAGIGGYFFYRHRKDKKGKKTKTTNGSTNSAMRNYTSVSTTDPSPPAPASAYVVQRSSPLPGSGAGTNSPGGFGALGVQYYTGSNNALNTSVNSVTPSTRPTYPYNPRGGNTGPAINMNPNPGTRPAPGPPPGNPSYPYAGSNRAPSVASSSSRSSYHGGVAPGPPVPQMRPQNGSLAGSEV